MKPPKNTPLLRFVQYFYQYIVFQKSEGQFFDKRSIDVKSALTFEKWPPAAELKIENIFNFSSDTRAFF